MSLILGHWYSEKSGDIFFNGMNDGAYQIHFCV